MPDTGDFDHRIEPQGPRSWGDAFTALPQETPDAGGWQRVQARLPVPASCARARWPLWLATAASLVLAVAIPLRLLPQVDTPSTPAVTQITATPATLPPTTQSSALPPVAIKPTPVATPIAKRHTPRHDTRVAPSQRPIRTVAPPTDTTRVATVESPASADLEPLYAQSAQLESLLAIARDERVASGTSAALADGLDARLASIDAALLEPDIDTQRHADLWDQRVHTLQQLVGIETTQRLYAARGQSYQAALVSVD